MVKTVPTATMFRNELRACTLWVPHFADHAPAMLDANPALRTLILQRLPGRTEWSFHPTVRREAGRLLARIHSAAAPVAEGPGLARSRPTCSTGLWPNSPRTRAARITPRPGWLA